MTIENILSQDAEFRYALLDRMKQDCQYYLTYGNRNVDTLWASTEQDQINTMKALWNSFPDDQKPEWLTWDGVLSFEKRMIHSTATASITKAELRQKLSEGATIEELFVLPVVFHGIGNRTRRIAAFVRFHNIGNIRSLVVNVHAVIQKLFVIRVNHRIVVFYVGIGRICVESVDCNKENHKRKNHRQARREHRHTVLFVHFHNLLVIHILIVCVLLLQFFHAFLILFHFQVLLTHRNTLENIERQRNKLERQREQNNPHADATRNGNQPTDKFADPIELYYVEGVPENQHGNFCK